MGAGKLQYMNEAPMAGSLTGKTALIVEDDALIAEAAFDALRDAGAKPLRPCATIVDALNIINTTAIDVALVDVNLSGMRSHAVMQALQAKNIPFVAATAYQIAASLGGATMIVEKPYLPEEACAVMEQALAAQRETLSK